MPAGHVASDRVGCFLEGYGFLPEDSRVDNRMDAGITILINDNMQWDISGGVGLSKNAPDNFISTGLSLRFLTR